LAPPALVVVQRTTSPDLVVLHNWCGFFPFCDPESSPSVNSLVCGSLHRRHSSLILCSSSCQASRFSVLCGLGTVVSSS
jgi:hypothetical protein